MHDAANQFLNWVAKTFPAFFKSGTRVLDVGSGDLNGNNHALFPPGTTYVGNDVAPGPNVTIVSKTSALPFPDAFFDVIVSSECFEHDPEYAASLRKMYAMLKPGGLMFFTCASTGRPEHGTRRTTPKDSLATMADLSEWSDYYKNLNSSDVNKVWSDSRATFAGHSYYYNSKAHDLYFWGVKPTHSAADLLYQPAYAFQYKGDGITAM